MCIGEQRLQVLHIDTTSIFKNSNSSPYTKHALALRKKKIQSSQRHRVSLVYKHKRDIKKKKKKKEKRHAPKPSQSSRVSIHSHPDLPGVNVVVTWHCGHLVRLPVGLRVQLGWGAGCTRGAPYPIHFVARCLMCSKFPPGKATTGKSKKEKKNTELTVFAPKKKRPEKDSARNLSDSMEKSGGIMEYGDFTQTQKKNKKSMLCAAAQIPS